MYRLTREAAEDIRRIYREGHRTFGREQADRYHGYLAHVFEILGENPNLARRRDEIVPPVRVHPCGSHLVIYTEHERGGILVIRVRNHRENWRD